MFKNLKKKVLSFALSAVMVIGAGGGFSIETRAAETVTPMISVEVYHTVALKSDGIVWC